jgi:hypothetical protein
MPDLLTHTLVGFTIGTVLSWQIDWAERHYVTAVMVGAVVPDLVKVKLLVPSAQLADSLGIPFSWLPLHTLGGAALSVLLIGTLVVGESHRRRALLMIAIGALSHLVLDGLLRTPTGRGGPVFWPITAYQPPTPGLYLSTDPWPAALAVAIAAVVVYVDRRVVSA